MRTKQYPEGIDAQKRRTVAYTVVGTYTVPDPGSPAWFDLSRFTGLDDLRVPPQRGTGSEPTAPALLVAPASMTSQTFRVGVDRPVDTSAVDLAEMDRAAATAQRFKTAAIDAADGGQDEVLPDLDLGSVFDQVRSERTLLSRVMIAALTPLVLLTLLLLFALVSTAAQARRTHVALAKLRGQSRAQVLRFALAEPFLVVALAVPVGVAIAVGTAQVVARGWLHPGIPVSLDGPAVASLLAVVAAALVASTVAALGVIREPLSASLTASVRPRPASRVALVLRSAVVAVALAAVGNLLTSGDQSSQLLALLTPMLVALAVAVGGAGLLRLLGRLWMRRTASGGGTAAYLASRRLGRRQDVANLMVPLLLAAAVLTFAASTTATSDAWRVARADAEVGAARSYIASSSPGRLLQVTREVDPEGRYVAAAATNTVGDDMSRSVFVDTSRLDRVVAWDPSWSDRSLASLQQRLTLDHAKRITFTGRRLAGRPSATCALRSAHARAVRPADAVRRRPRRAARRSTRRRAPQRHGAAACSRPTLAGCAKAVRARAALRHRQQRLGQRRAGPADHRLASRSTGRPSTGGSTTRPPGGRPGRSRCRWSTRRSRIAAGPAAASS